MRLLHLTALELKEFIGREVPRYAILSHTWGEDETTFWEFSKGLKQDSIGYGKLRGFCEVALSYGLQWGWIDTCCIDRTSSAELTEAVNSMYSWYSDCDVCIVYLADVDIGRSATEKGHGQETAHKPFVHMQLSCDAKFLQLTKSRWFTRGWTLQELLAPIEVIFYDSRWEHIGSKNSDLRVAIEAATGIAKEYLEEPKRCTTASIAQRMSWAAHRQTTRHEDMAYCLMGLFEVNMLLLYGEGGAKAFSRLQEEIIRKTEDQSIFAWSGPERQLLAPSPRGFAGWRDDCNQIASTHLGHPFVVTNRGMYVNLPIVWMETRLGELSVTHGKTCLVAALENHQIPRGNWSPDWQIAFAILNLKSTHQPTQHAAIKLQIRRSNDEILEAEMHDDHTLFWLQLEDTKMWQVMDRLLDLYIRLYPRKESVDAALAKSYPMNNNLTIHHPVQTKTMPRTSISSARSIGRKLSGLLDRKPVPISLSLDHERELRNQHLQSRWIEISSTNGCEPQPENSTIADQPVTECTEPCGQGDNNGGFHASNADLSPGQQQSLSNQQSTGMSSWLGRKSSGREPSSKRQKLDDREIPEHHIQNGFPCIYRKRDPLQYGNHTKLYKHISELVRHLKSHEFYACHKCVTKFIDEETQLAHRCVKSTKCTKKCCKKRYNLNDIEPNSCSCITTALQQWNALFRLAFPGIDIPDITLNDEAEQQARHCEMHIDRPQSREDRESETVTGTGTGTASYIGSKDEATNVSIQDCFNGISDEVNSWEIGDPPIAHAVEMSALRAELQELRRKVHLYEQRESMPPQKERDLEMVLANVWQAFQRTGNTDCQPGSPLCQLVGRFAPGVLCAVPPRQQLEVPPPENQLMLPDLDWDNILKDSDKSGTSCEHDSAYRSLG